MRFIAGLGKMLFGKRRLWIAARARLHRPLVLLLLWLTLLLAVDLLLDCALVSGRLFSPADKAVFRSAGADRHPAFLS
jgi:hypothetical protein